MKDLIHCYYNPLSPLIVSPVLLFLKDFLNSALGPTTEVSSRLHDIKQGAGPTRLDTHSDH